MALPDFYSRRKRAASPPSDDVFVYDEVPAFLRTQILLNIEATLGPPFGGGYSRGPNASRQLYNRVVEILREELGQRKLANSAADNTPAEFAKWFEQEPSIDNLLDGIELFFRAIDSYVRNNGHEFRGKRAPDDAIAQLNARFREAGVGYAFVEGEIVRVDSQLLHAEAVVPALQLIGRQGFEAADSEYRKAHEAYRRGDFETCLVECGKALESVLKVVGGLRGWTINSNDTAKKLLDAAYAAGFIDPALQASFTALRSLLESAVPTVRNKLGGHGAGTTPRVIPQEVASLQLHQTAVVIKFIVEHHDATP